MYLSKIKLWNFRKFGSEKFDIKKPNLVLEFNRNLNLIIGENDSGKTAIIDAIKIVLKTHSYEWIRVTEDDFYKKSDRFRIELEFKDLKDEEAKFFTEWLSLEKEDEKFKPYLKVNYDVSKTDDRILPADIRAGSDEEGYPLSAEARSYLKTTYLKPLRDAESELIPKRYSRLSQILKGHEIFEDEEDNALFQEFEDFNKTIAKYFKKSNGDDQADHEGYKVKKVIDRFIEGFYDKDSKSEFRTSEANLRSVLETLELTITDIDNPGLGTLNRLFMAVELLHLNKENWPGLKLGLIEEIEAHLHPQVQMKVIDTLKDNEDIQLILTTHSPNLASKIKLENLIICTNDNAFPMGDKYTELNQENYIFLEKFLDVTKSNLFFAKGVILVEGWSEEILIPALAKKIGYDLTEYEVSVINIGNVGFKHYYRIFLRQDNPDAMGTRVAVINDLDVRKYKINKAYDKDNNSDVSKVKEKRIDYKKKCRVKKTEKEDIINKFKSVVGIDKEQTIVKPCISPEWTLEWCLFKSKYFKNILTKVLKNVHPQIFKDIANIETELAYRLIKGGSSLDKTKIANELVKVMETGKINGEEIEIDFDNKRSYKCDTISYLIEAIEYVCGD
jgi:putative ATP-dependent endonuclease of OLD family